LDILRDPCDPSFSVVGTDDSTQCTINDKAHSTEDPSTANAQRGSTDTKLDFSKGCVNGDCSADQDCTNPDSGCVNVVNIAIMTFINMPLITYWDRHR
jgi:hypothetical protein